MLQEIMPFVSRHPILSLAWIALLVAVIVMTFKSRFSKVKEIARGEAIRLINKEEAVVVDTRSRDDFRRGHLANAINLTASEIKNGSFGRAGKTQSAADHRRVRQRHRLPRAGGEPEQGRF